MIVSRTVSSRDGHVTFRNSDITSRGSAPGLGRAPSRLRLEACDLGLAIQFTREAAVSLGVAYLISRWSRRPPQREQNLLNSMRPVSFRRFFSEW